VPNRFPALSRLGLAVAAASLVLGGCAVQPPKPYDYSAFKQSRPASILVLPPTHSTPNIRASDSVWAQVSRPLAESGYYVLPVSLVSESLKQNGVTEANEAQQLPLNKLRDVFGADAVLYLNVSQYGTVFQVLNSVTTVAVSARLVDGRTGQLLWEGAARASDAENRQQQNQQGLVGLLVQAVVTQIASNIADVSHPLAGTANARLLSAGRDRALLYGPRHPGHAVQFAPNPAGK
jgi:hypothetical protein